jgi:hypothetical protein
MGTRGGHFNQLRFPAAWITLRGEVARLKLEERFVLGHNKVVIHVPGYPRIAILLDIEERDLNTSFPSFLGWQTRHSRVLLLVGAASPKRPVISHPELPSPTPAIPFVRLLIRIRSLRGLILTIRADGLKHSFQDKKFSGKEERIAELFVGLQLSG